MQQFVALSLSIFATIASYATPNQPLTYLGIPSDHTQLCMQPNFGFLSFGVLASFKQDPNLFMIKIKHNQHYLSFICCRETFKE
jgi:hypothetical protein